MTKIESFSLHNLRNTEHFQFMTDVDQLITTATPLELGIDGLYPSFNTALAAEDATMRTELGSLRSKAIEDFDTLRDNTWNAISMRVNASLLCPFQDEINSATVLRRLIDLYGDVRSRSYNEESASISNLVNDFTKPENLDHVNKLGLLNWINELKNENDQFQYFFNERNAEFAERESGDVRAVRILIDPIYQKIVDRINASVVMEIATPVAESFISQLNEKIKYYKTTLVSRSSRSKTEETAPTA
jgi:hypothetical protein